MGPRGLQPLHRPVQRSLVKATRRKETTMRDLKSIFTATALAVASGISDGCLGG